MIVVLFSVDDFARFYIHTYGGIFMNAGAACNYVVYYSTRCDFWAERVRSTIYRKALRNQLRAFRLLAKCDKINVILVQTLSSGRRT